jgi:hypothetical protein
MSDGLAAAAAAHSSPPTRAAPLSPPMRLLDRSPCLPPAGASLLRETALRYQRIRNGKLATSHLGDPGPHAQNQAVSKQAEGSLIFKNVVWKKIARKPIAKAVHSFQNRFGLESFNLHDALVLAKKITHARQHAVFESLDVDLHNQGIAGEVQDVVDRNNRDLVRAIACRFYDSRKSSINLSWKKVK